MENLEFLKNKLIRAINESSDRELIAKLWEMANSEKKNIVSEPQSVYKSEKAMTDEEVDKDFKEDEIKLHPVYMKMIERGMEDVRNGHVLTEEEMDKMDEEWLN